MSKRLYIQDVATRDGFQIEATFVPTEDKIALCNALSSAGLSKIEVTSFTSPTAIPALKDAEIVMREITRRPGTVYTALVPNLRGAERAIESRTDELNLVMSVSATPTFCGPAPSSPSRSASRSSPWATSPPAPRCPGRISSASGATTTCSATTSGRCC